MTSFHYKALTSDGKARSGVLVADDSRAVARDLRKMGMTPTFVGTAKPSGFSFELPRFRSNTKEILHFTQETATLLNAGIPLDRALTIVSELAERKDFQGVVQDMQRSLRGGKSFADTLTTHPEVFTELYVSMVRAGEVSGTLPLVMDRLAEFERDRDELRGYILSSLTYPALLVLVGCGSVFVLLKYVIPRFAEAFTTANMEIPLPMQVLLGTSNLVQQWGLPILALLGAAGFGLQAWVRSSAGRLRWDGFLLRTPLLGDALLKADTSRLARAMATLIANTVPLVQALEISKGILSNKVLAAALDPVARGVKRGEGLAGPLTRTAKFPALAGHLLTVGEETGRLDKMFERMADIYDKDTRAAVRRFTALFEPIVILVMGIIVGAMILSIMLALTSINQMGF